MEAAAGCASFERGPRKWMTRFAVFQATGADDFSSHSRIVGRLDDVPLRLVVGGLFQLNQLVQREHVVRVSV